MILLLTQVLTIIILAVLLNHFFKENKSGQKLNKKITQQLNPEFMDIEQIDEDNFRVNSKLVSRDMNNKWLAQARMTTQEVAAFQKYILKNEV